MERRTVSTKYIPMGTTNLKSLPNMDTMLGLSKSSSHVQYDVITSRSSTTMTTKDPYAWTKFRPILVKEMIHSVLMEQLQGKEYNGEECTEWTKTISDQIKIKLKDMGYDRYKFIVQVVIGEQRGEGVKMGCRCFWDSDTDNYAQDIFMNDSLFCVAAAFGVFFY